MPAFFTKVMSASRTRITNLATKIKNTTSGIVGKFKSFFRRSEPDAYCNRLAEVYTDLKNRDLLPYPLPCNPSISASDLSLNPALQAKVAAATAYTPSKWLLEQELTVRISNKSVANQPSTQQPSWDRTKHPAEDVFDAADREELAGLSFSGGGIRSATFCLGVLQGFAQEGILQRFDYLSTVSGGGYIHQWLASWIANTAVQNQNSSARDVVIKKLIPLPERDSAPRWPEQINWLRRYSSYLTPRRGLFSADTWTLAATWFRNAFLNQIVLFGFLALCIFLARALTSRFFFHQFVRVPESWTVWSEAHGIRTVLRTVFLTWLAASVARFTTALISLRGQSAQGFLKLQLPADRSVAVGIVLPGFLLSLLVAAGCNGVGDAAYWLKVWIFYVASLTIGLTVSGIDWKNNFWDFILEIGGWLGRRRNWLLLCFAAGSISVSAGLASLLFSPTAPHQERRLLVVFAERVAHSANSILPISIADLSVHQEMKAINGDEDHASTLDLKMTHVSPAGVINKLEVMAMLGPVAFFALQFLALRLQAGLMGRNYAESRREWLARYGAWGAMFSSVWTLLVFVARLGPPVCAWVAEASTLKRLGALAGVVLTHAITLYAGASGKSDGTPKKTGMLFGYSGIDLVGMVGAPVCILILLVCTSGLVERTLRNTTQATNIKCIPMIAKRDPAVAACNALPPGEAIEPNLKPPPVTSLGAPSTNISTRSDEHISQSLIFNREILIPVVVFILTLIFGWRIDVNDFSMHGFYRNRLARCYLGATNPKRAPDPFTGLDDKTETGTVANAQLSSLRPMRFGGTTRFDGPFPIFCSTLNLTTGEDLASQQRKGASFAFTPLYSGYQVGWTSEKRRTSETSFNGFVDTKTYAYPNGGIALASVAAISGAAASPNMGYNSQPALAFLMTLFNVRLSWWIANPRKPKIWPASNQQPTPRVGLKYLLSELFGMSNDTSNYVCLSDGGHFENMGAYELFRRRCKFIVICDAESDSKCVFEGIGGAIAKARTDFGAEIDLDLRPLIPDPITGLSKRNYVMGKIHYPAPPGSSRQYTGTIVYIKTSLMGDEPGDILHHRRIDSSFPNDTTLNQFFTESDFESYRRLGQLISVRAAAIFA